MPAFVAPVLKKTWSLSGPEIGKIFGAGLAGLTVGSFAIGPLADKIGRKTVVLTSLAAFGILSFASAFASSLHVLIVLRFLGGLGLGATNPSCYALVSEIFPDKKRSLTVSIVTSGISMGGAIAGGVAAFVIPHFGWQSAFIVGGAIPLIMIPPLFLLLPDSIRYLALNGKSDEKLKIILNKIAPEEDFIGAHFIIGERYLEGSPIKQLLGKGLVGGTLLLWLSMFVALIVIWFITYWLPSLVNNAGSSVETASLTTSVLLFGIVSGCFLNCYLMSKLRPTSCVSAFCVSTFVLLMALGRIPLGQTSYVLIST
jgi:MFS transporter, AAHS family, 4-hydroxybenzoate transporter